MRWKQVCLALTLTLTLIGRKLDEAGLSLRDFKERCEKAEMAAAAGEETKVESSKFIDLTLTLTLTLILTQG